MLPVLQLGPLALPVPGLVLLLGLWLGLLLAERNAYRSGISSNHLYNLVFTALIAGLVGARLAYVLQYPQAFLADPLSVISRNTSLLDPLGGGLVAILAGLVYGQRKRLPFWSTLDALTPFLAVFAVALGLSHLASGSAFGRATDLPWGFEIWGETRHPSQVYETLAAMLILAALWPGRGLLRPSQPGVYFLEFIALSAASRLLLEVFRGDSVLLAGGFRSAQILAWVILGLSLLGLSKLRQTPKSPESIQSGEDV